MKAYCEGSSSSSSDCTLAQRQINPTTRWATSATKIFPCVSAQRANMASKYCLAAFPSRTCGSRPCKKSCNSTKQSSTCRASSGRYSRMICITLMSCEKRVPSPLLFRHPTVPPTPCPSGSSGGFVRDSQRTKHYAGTHGNEGTANADDPQGDRQTGDLCREADQWRPGQKATVPCRRHGGERRSRPHPGNSAGATKQDGDNIRNPQAHQPEPEDGRPRLANQQAAAEADGGERAGRAQ